MSTKASPTMSLKHVATQTLALLSAGRYETQAGEVVEIGPALEAAKAGTRLYEPHQVESLLERAPTSEPAGPRPLRIEVTDETTQLAAQRLCAADPSDLVLLNFASARNPGGGFLNGAKAQEEDVARCSGLYPCLQVDAALTYYQRNRAQSSLLYTDHALYSPRVPFFRVKSRGPLVQPFHASVITSPAPNAGQAKRHGVSGSRIEAALRRRAGHVLAIAQDQGHRRLLLGAWGCGVFRNDPARAADAFGQWLTHPRFQGAFDEVTFAVYDRGKHQPNLNAFRARFGS